MLPTSTTTEPTDRRNRRIGVTGDLCTIVRVNYKALRVDFPTEFSLSCQLLDVAVVKLCIIAIEVSNWGIEAAIEGALHPINNKSGNDFVPSVKTADCTRGSRHLRTYQWV
jgi:hypothetical protein